MTVQMLQTHNDDGPLRVPNAVPAPDISARGGDLVELYNDGQKPTVGVQSKAGHGGEV